MITEAFMGDMRFTSNLEREVCEDPHGALLADSPADVALEARIAAHLVHGGQSSALYAFTSSGYLDTDDVRCELVRMIGQPDCGPIADALLDWICGVELAS